MARYHPLVRIEILFLLVLSALTLFAVVRLERQVTETSPSAPPLPRGFVWGGRTFVDVQSFAHWLRSRGYDYEVWARNHRHRAGLPPIHSQLLQKSPEALRPGRRSTWAAWIVAGGGFGFVVCILALRRRWHRVAWRHTGAKGEPRFRIDVIATGHELRRLGRAVATIARAARAVVSGERGELVPRSADRAARFQRLAFLVRSMPRRAACPSGDLLWYCAATLLALAMGVGVAFWG